jgi:leader peptidase (prepilin peptidase)/N-methyltransferase
MTADGTFGAAAPATQIVYFVYACFAVASIALAIVDARTKLLPNRIIFPLYGIGLLGFGLATAVQYPTDGVHRLVTAVVAAAASYALFYAIAMFGPLGYGDVKLAGVIGLYLGWIGAPVVFTGLMLGTVSAALVTAVVVATRSARRLPWRRMEVAYGPYLLFGAWAALLISQL